MNDIVVDGGTIYVGGTFTSVGGQVRNRIAALDAVTGVATPWNPNPNSLVNVLLLDGGTLYVGGAFTTIGGQTRNRLAELSTATGVVTAWNPNANNQVLDLKKERLHDLRLRGLLDHRRPDARRHRRPRRDDRTGDAMGSGGEQPGLRDPARRQYGLRLRHLHDDGRADAQPDRRHRRHHGRRDAWDPNANGGVYPMALYGHDVVIGGDFTFVGGQTRNRLAIIDDVTGLADFTWDPNASASVYAIDRLGTRLCVGGNFSYLDGQWAQGLAVIPLPIGVAAAPDASAGDGGPRVRPRAQPGEFPRYGALCAAGVGPRIIVDLRSCGAPRRLVAQPLAA